MRRVADRSVHPVAFGAMNLSLEGRPDRVDAIATIHAALEAGVMLFDTADSYGEVGEAHHNERLLAEALHDADALITTKAGVVRHEGDRWEHRGDPAHLRAACERSLVALGTECLPLFQLHAVDGRVPIEESIGALEELRQEGKVRHIGVSNVSRAELLRAMATATIASVQNEASPFVPPDREVLSLCETNDMAFLAYAPMGGWRASRIAHEDPLRRVANAHGASPFEVVIAWLLAQSSILIPVCGASRPDNARSSANAAALRLKDEELRMLTRRYWKTDGARA